MPVCSSHLLDEFVDKIKISANGICLFLLTDCNFDLSSLSNSNSGDPLPYPVVSSSPTASSCSHAPSSSLSVTNPSVKSVDKMSCVSDKLSFLKFLASFELFNRDLGFTYFFIGKNTRRGGSKIDFIGAMCNSDKVSLRILDVLHQPPLLMKKNYHAIVTSTIHIEALTSVRSSLELKVVDSKFELNKSYDKCFSFEKDGKTVIRRGKKSNRSSNFAICKNKEIGNITNELYEIKAKNKKDQRKSALAKKGGNQSLVKIFKDVKSMYNFSSCSKEIINKHAEEIFFYNAIKPVLFFMESDFLKWKNNAANNNVKDRKEFFEEMDNDAEKYINTLKRLPKDFLISHNFVKSVISNSPVYHIRF